MHLNLSKLKLTRPSKLLYPNIRYIKLLHEENCIQQQPAIKLLCTLSKALCRSFQNLLMQENVQRDTSVLK